MEEPVRMTWKQLIAGIVSLLIGGYAILQFVTGGMQASLSNLEIDGREIRAAIVALQGEDKTLRSVVAGTDVGLRDKIFDTHVIATKNNSAIQALQVSVDGMQKNIDAMRADIRTGFTEVRADLRTLIGGREKKQQ